MTKFDQFMERGYTDVRHEENLHTSEGVICLWSAYTIAGIRMFAYTYRDNDGVKRTPFFASPAPALDIARERAGNSLFQRG